MIYVFNNVSYMFVLLYVNVQLSAKYGSFINQIVTSDATIYEFLCHMS